MTRSCHGRGPANHAIWEGRPARAFVRRLRAHGTRGAVAGSRRPEFRSLGRNRSRVGSGLEFHYRSNHAGRERIRKLEGSPGGNSFRTPAKCLAILSEALPPTGFLGEHAVRGSGSWPGSRAPRRNWSTKDTLPPLSPWERFLRVPYLLSCTHQWGRPLVGGISSICLADKTTPLTLWRKLPPQLAGHGLDPGPPLY
jgi:hypothetical protein